MTELPELYWSPTQGVVLRIGDGRVWSVHNIQVMTPGNLVNGLPIDAVRLVAGRAAAELPLIPDTYRFQRDRVTFVTYEDTWHLLGPADRLPVGRLVWVDRFADDTNQQILVGVHVAERTVRHRDGTAVTYAIAKIDRGGNQ